MNSAETNQLLGSIADGDDGALDQLLSDQRDYLRRLLEARMEPGLRRRVDASDIIQEAFLVATNRIDDYLDRRPTSFRLWLRRKTMERLVEARRKHFAQVRSIEREVPLTDASSMAIARYLISERPSAVVRRRELGGQVHEAMSAMSELDREILVLRNVEQLTNSEVAQLLEIDQKTASKRYGRAILRLAQTLHRKGFSE